jgi:hypothetical protein
MAKTDFESLGANALGSLEGLRTEAEVLEQEMTPEEAQAAFEKAVAKVTQVLSRGTLNDRMQEVLDAATPRGRVGKFVRDDETTVIRHKNLGYTFDVNPVSGMHDKGDGKVRIGDAVVMTVSLNDHAVLVEANKRSTRRKLGLGKQEYINASQSGAAAPSFDAGSQIIIDRTGGR